MQIGKVFLSFFLHPFSRLTIVEYWEFMFNRRVCARLFSEHERIHRIKGRGIRSNVKQETLLLAMCCYLWFPCIFLQVNENWKLNILRTIRRSKHTSSRCWNGPIRQSDQRAKTLTTRYHKMPKWRLWTFSIFVFNNSGRRILNEHDLLITRARALATDRGALVRFADAIDNLKNRISNYQLRILKMRFAISNWQFDLQLAIDNLRNSICN